MAEIEITEAEIRAAGAVINRYIVMDGCLQILDTSGEWNVMVAEALRAARRCAPAIEVSPAMIEAGLAELVQFSREADIYEERVEAIYRAMESAKAKTMTGPDLSETCAPANPELESRVIEAVVSEFMDYFSVPAVSGLKLFESDARYIAAGVAQRVFRDPL